MQLRDNEVSDSITVYRNNILPKKPNSNYPKGEEVDFKGFVLKADAFYSKTAKAFHGASQWQIATTDNFEKPVFDSWKQFENWYYKVDRQKDDNLTDEKVHRLKADTYYFWRVRYRDQYLNWSPWSETANFKTSKE